MTENQQPENVVVVVETPLPTTQQQLITAAIGVGTLIAVPVVIAGSLAVVNGVMKGASAAKTKLSRKPKPQLTVVPDSVED